MAYKKCPQYCLLSIIKKIAIATLIALGTCIIAIALFVNFAPQFGAPPSGEDLERVRKSPNYQNGEFVNLVETTLTYGCSNTAKMIRDFLTVSGISPTQPLPVKFADAQSSPPDTLAYITWYGHSAFLIEMEGKRILLDPMFGPAASPVSFNIAALPLRATDQP